jgi:hypothetical protein
VLLFVFWYCHKRGRETRLEKEASMATTSGITAVESDAEVSDSALSEDESDRAMLEAALRRPEPAGVPLPPPSGSETKLK